MFKTDALVAVSWKTFEVSTLVDMHGHGHNLLLLFKKEK